MFTALNRMYSVINQVDINFRHRQTLGGGKSLGQKSGRP
jgi:hypothetical protein